ncbi:MAG: chloride channel protein [Planctomycetia bacterium]|nr:chloride channel protein [Planctomycetia bacterium]
MLTPICISGGFHGGVFAPALFPVLHLGVLMDSLLNRFSSSLNISPPAFAMVRMAAVLTSTRHAPITSFMLLFEMTHDYRIILPLIAAVNVNLFLSWHLQHDSVYTLDWRARVYVCNRDVMLACWKQLRLTRSWKRRSTLCENLVR